MRIAFIVVLALATVEAQSGPGGEILFQSDREGPTRLFIIDVATKAQRRVGSAGNWMDEEPAWSRDGRRIAFSSTRGGNNNFDIWVMDADGSNLTRLTDHPAPEQDPIWAHDDKSLFFTGKRDGHGQIYRVWIAGKRVERITESPAQALMPAASADGRYLAYAAQVDSFQLFLLDFTTGVARQITVGDGACRPSFAPDSQEIAFVRLGEGQPSHLEAVREEGPRVVRKDSRVWSYYPDYSPDGRYLAFSVSPEHHEGEDWDLALMDLQKPGAVVTLTSGRGNDRYPDWRPPVR
jgi:Tol biopolymer transport system component